MDRSEALKMAQKLRADGLTYKEIAEKLVEVGYISNPKKPEKPVNRSTIKRWLNPDKPKGKPQKRAKGVQAKLPEPVREPTPEDRIERLKSAHAGALAEVDRLSAELSEAQDQITKLNSELSKTKKESKPDMNELQQAITSAVSEAVKPLYAEIEALKERYESFLKINKPRTQSPVHCLRWNVQKSGKYFKAYRKVNGKVRGVHIGPEYDPDQAKEKIIGAIQRNGGKWGLTQTEINSLIKGNDPAPTKEDQADHQDKQELIKSLIFKRRASGRFARIEVLRADYPYDDFDSVLTDLAGRYLIELHIGGVSGDLTFEEIKGAYYDEHGERYLTVSWVE